MKSINSVICLMLMLLSVFLQAAPKSRAEERSFNSHDRSLVVNFLEQEVKGKKNGNILYGDKYRADDYTTWTVDRSLYEGYSAGTLPKFSGAQTCFNFDGEGYLREIDLGYTWYKTTEDGIHADGKSFFPVGGDFIFEDCKRLETIVCGSHFSSVRLSALPKLKHPDFVIYSTYDAYLPVPDGYGYVSATSREGLVRAWYYANGNDLTLSLSVPSYADSEKTNAFKGWYNRFTGELVSKSSKLSFSGKVLAESYTCVIEAVYENGVIEIENGEHYLPVGDANNDNYVNTADATEILKYAADMDTECVLLLADSNRDGVVNTCDAVLILKFSAGIIHSL